jgi:hypothetical protein
LVQSDICVVPIQFGYGSIRPRIGIKSGIDYCGFTALKPNLLVGKSELQQDFVRVLSNDRRG